MKGCLEIKINNVKEFMYYDDINILIYGSNYIKYINSILGLFTSNSFIIVLVY